MNISQVGSPKPVCISCRKKRRIQVELTAYQLNSSLGIYMCTTNECLYPLNSKNLHKFVFKVGPHGNFLPCDPSEVPNLKDLFALLSANAKQRENPLASSSVSSAPPCDIKQVPDEVVPLKEERVDIELACPQSANVEQAVKRETCDESISYGAKFGTSSNIFPIWENKDALCWLDSTLCLLVHSKNLKTYFKLDTFGECQLKDISIAYDEAVSILNSAKTSAAAGPDVPFANLERVRERTFEFLQPFQRCEKGQEDSPVFAIMALLRQNRFLNNLFLLHFLIELKCSSCDYTKISPNKKTLVTVPGAVEDFSENSLIYLRPCFHCQKPDQKITLKFLKLPPLLLVHFVEGLPHSDISSYDMVFSSRGYCVRGFVQYREPERHFITWVRDDSGHRWMCCDDLNPPVQRFKAELPDIAASEIHIVMWEQKETTDGDNLHLHYSDDEKCHGIVSSIESTTPPLITLDDSDSEVEAKSQVQISREPLFTVNNPPSIKSDTEISGERTISPGKQHEQVPKNNTSSNSSCEPLSPFHTSIAGVSKELKHPGDLSLLPDSRYDSCGDLVSYSSSNDASRKGGIKQQEFANQNVFPIVQKESPVQKDDPDLTPTQELSDKDYICNDNGLSKDDFISDSVFNQDGKETNASCLPLTNERQVLQFPIDIGKDKDLSCESSVHDDTSKTDDNKSVHELTKTKIFSSSRNEEQVPESDIHCTISGPQVVDKDVRDKDLLYHCEENENHLNTQPGRNITSIKDHDACKKNLEGKPSVGVCSSSLSEKKNNLCDSGQNNIYAGSACNRIRQSVKQEIKQETVHGQSKLFLDIDELCKTVRPCLIVIDRSEADLHCKKLLEQKTNRRTRSLKKDKYAQKATSCIDSSTPATAPVTYRKQSKKKKAAPLMKQSSFDARLQDTGTTITDEKLQGTCVLDSCPSDPVASVSAMPSEKFPKEQGTEKFLENSALQSPVPSHISNQNSDLAVHEIEPIVVQCKLSVEGEQDLAETPKMNTSSSESSGAKQDMTLQNDNSDCNDTHFLSSRSLSLNYSVANMMEENLRTCYEAVTKELKNENLHTMHEGLDEESRTAGEMSVTFDPVVEHKLNNDQTLKTQTFSYPNLPLVQHDVLQDLDTSNKVVNTCESSGLKLRDEKSSVSAGLSENGIKSGISIVTESKGSKISASLCDEDCTCDLCSVKRFIQNYESDMLKSQDASRDTKVSQGRIEIPDENVSSSETNTSVVEQAEQCLGSTPIIQDKNHVSPKEACSAKVCMQSNSLSEENSCHRTSRRKMPSRKCAVSRQNQNTEAKKKSCKNAIKGLEIPQDPEVCFNNLHDKTCEVSHETNGHCHELTDKNFGTATMTELPHEPKNCQDTELGYSEEQDTIPPVRKHKSRVKTNSASVGALHLFESTVQENLNEPMELSSLPVGQEETCKSIEEQVSKRVKYEHLEKQGDLCVGSVEEEEEENVEIQFEKSGACKNSPVSKRLKRQHCSKESFNISPPVSDIVTPKEQYKHECDKQNSVRQKSVLFSDDCAGDSVLPKRKVERKFEPDSIKFVEVPVDSQSSDAESVNSEEKCDEMPQSVTVELSNLSPQKQVTSCHDTKKKNSSIVEYKGITAEFGVSVEGDVLEFVDVPAKEEHSFNRMPSPCPSQSDPSNIRLSYCEPERQGILTASGIHHSANGAGTATPVFGSVDLLRAHLYSESHDSSEQLVAVKESDAPGSSNSIGPQIDMSHSFSKRNHGHNKPHIVLQKNDKSGIKKCNSLEVQISEKSLSPQKTGQKSPKPQKGGSKKLHCDDSAVAQKKMPKEINTKRGQKGNENCMGAAEIGKGYLVDVKKMIYIHNEAPECLITTVDQQNRSELSSPSKPSAETNKITTDMTAKTKDVSPSYHNQANSEVAKGILAEKKERKKTKTVRFSLEPNDAKNSSNIAMPQKVNTKKRRNVTEETPRKKNKNETAVSSAQNVAKSENHSNQSELDDAKAAGIKVKSRNLSQGAPAVSTMSLGLVNPFLYCPKDLTLNYSFSVPVPKPQVRKSITKAESSEIR